MGMFDNVNYEARCPKCKTMLNDWQTKNTQCHCDLVEPWEAEYFYTSCPNCDAWIDADVDSIVEHIVKKCDVTLEIRGDRN